MKIPPANKFQAKNAMLFTTIIIILYAKQWQIYWHSDDINFNFSNECVHHRRRTQFSSDCITWTVNTLQLHFTCVLLHLDIFIYILYRYLSSVSRTLPNIHILLCHSSVLFNRFPIYLQFIEKILAGLQ